MISALTEKVNKALGVTRVRCSRGWLSVRAGDGSLLLRKHQVRAVPVPYRTYVRVTAAHRHMSMP